MEQTESGGAGVRLHPPSATLEELWRSPPERVLLSVAYCCKSLECEHRFADYCDPECSRCELSRVQRASTERGIAFRIETTNDDLLAFLGRESGRLDWIIGVACPCEVGKLAPLFWERFHLRQAIFPLGGEYCRSLEDRRERRDHDARIRLSFDAAPLLALLGRWPRRTG